MFGSENQITITQFANVWAVVVPKIPEQDMQVKMAKTIMGEAMKVQNRDDLLHKLDPSLYEDEFNPTPFLQRKIPNVHIFKTWGEVVKFIGTIDETTL